MEISDDKLKAFLEKLNVPACPLCGNRDWSYETKVFNVNQFFPDKLIIGGSALLVIPLTCTKCGNTNFINVLSAGLITSDEIDKEKNKSKHNNKDK